MQGQKGQISNLQFFIVNPDLQYETKLFGSLLHTSLYSFKGLVSYVHFLMYTYM